MRTRAAARRRASRLRHEPARDHRRDAARLGRGDAREPGGGRWLDLPAVLRARRISSTASATRTASSISRRIGRRTPYANDGLKGDWARHADPARPLGGERGGGWRAPVQARDLAGPQFPQFDLQRDGDLGAREARPTALMHPADAATARRCGRRRRRLGNERGRTRLHAHVSPEARPGVIVSEGLGRPPTSSTGAGSTSLIGGRQRRALRRRGFPRHSGLASPGVTDPQRSARRLCGARALLRMRAFGGGAQRRDIGAIGGLVAALEHRGPRDNRVGARLGDKRGRLGIGAAVDFEPDRRARRSWRGCDGSFRAGRDEALASEARIDRHHQNEIDGIEHIFEGRFRASRDRSSRPPSCRAPSPTEASGGDAGPAS